MSDISSETINQMLADIRATMPETRESDDPTDPSELPPSATEPEDEPQPAPDQSPEPPPESTPESESTPTVPASEPLAPADASAHQAPQPSSSPSSPSLPPRTLSDDEYERYQAYQQLDQRLRSDPQFAEQFRQAIATQPTSEPAPESYISQDPAYVTLQQQLQQLNSVLSRHEAIISQQAEIENAATMTRAKEAFKSAHSLDATQMQRVYDEAQSLAPAMQTYAAQGLDQQTALGKLFESAYWQIPEFRDKEMASYLETSRADQKRKAKAGSLSGSSGSVPRSTNRPLNEQEKRSAMIKEIADSIGQPTE